MSWHKSFDEYVNNQNNGQSSLNSGGNTTVTHNGKTYYSGNSNGSAFQSYVSSKKHPEDIAPVASRVITRSNKKKEEEEEKKKRKWFEKGLFEDGYDFGDVTRTILGTATDTLENLGSGIIGMGEKAVDAIAYIAPFAENAQFYQNGGGYNPELQKQHEQVVEQSKKDLGKFIAKDLYDEEKVARAIISDPARKIGIDSETQSVFGEKSDALIQSGGQLLATAGLAATGMPWWLTTGVTSFGSEAENAMNQGATYEQAGASAAISAGAEILSEKLSGGISFGGKSLDDALTKQLARGISNKLGRTAAKLGLDMVGEGSEEVFSQLASNLGSSLYKEEDITELLFSEEAMDGYLESFIGGAALGGVSNAYNAVKSNSKGVDYTSGLTQNEQKVVDKLYKDEIASREKEGKVTQKEKSKIYDSILEDMEKGYISIDTIEEVLGGEKYNQYKQTAEWEDSLQTEFDTLNKMKQGEMTGEQVDRREALRTQIQNVKATSSQAQLRSQIRDEVMGLVKGDRLAESYNERARTGQKFEADVTQYDAKQQAVVQKAIDSGILNNSNRTHEFVDFVSKISADTGVLFDFSNTAKIREAGFAVEGQTVDGFITKDGITVNIDSPKSRQFVVGHEITHALEGTELYDALRKSVFDYAKMKNQYGVRMESIQKRYKEGTDFDAELTADLVGEYIFSDTDFVKHLSTQNRNVFQKVYDEIKYLCKVATAGSKEARELEKVKRAFEKAYREGGKTQGETKLSVGYHAGDLGKAESYFQQGGGRSTGHFGTGTYFVGNKAAIEGYNKRNGKPAPVETVEFDNYNLYKVYDDEKGRKLHENLHTIDRGFSQEYLDAAVKDKFRASELRKEAWDLGEKYETKEWNDELGFELTTNFYEAGIRAMTEVAKSNNVEFRTYEEHLEYIGEDVKPGDDDYDLYQDEYYDYLKKLLEETDEKRNDGYSRFRDAHWDLRWTFGKDNVNRALQAVLDHDAVMENADYDTMSVSDSRATVFMKALGYEGIDVRGTRLDNTTYGSVIYDLKGEDAKRKAEIGTAKYSLSDSNGRELSKEQSEYFKDSKVRDKNGSLQVMYHGSPESFTVFDKKKAKSSGLYGKGFYFTNSDSHAKQYGNTYEVYLNITNPLQNGTNDITKDQLRSFVEAIAEDEDYGIENYGYEATVDSVTNNVFGKGDFAMLMDINVTCVGNMVEAIDLFNKVNGTGYDGIIAPTETVAFYPEQIKEVANQKPTEDKDIWFSLSDTVEETKDLIAVHNLHSGELIETLKLSGLPSPSVAIIKAKDGHDKYGDVSLILPKETIDPQTNKANRIYGSDAWTPTRSNAQVEYEVDYDIQRQFERTIEELSKNVANGVFSKSSVLGMAGIEDSTGLNLNEIAKKMSDYDAVQAAYVAENGGSVEVAYRTKEFDAYGNDALKGYLDNVGEQEVARLVAKMKTGERLTAEEIETAKDALVANWVVKKDYALRQKPELRDIRIAKFRERLTNMRVEDFVRHAWEFYQDSGSTTDEVNMGATGDNLHAAVNRADVEAWVSEKLQGLLSEPGIYNGKEIYTPSGRRRSFKETHWDYTAENIVRAMNNADARGANVWNVSGEAIIATATQEYKNIDEVRADKGRLFNAEYDDYEKIKDGISAELQTVTKDIIRTTEHISDNQYDEEQIIGRVIMEAAQGTKTVAGVKRVFQKNGYRVGDAQAKSVLSLFDHASSVPTGYFEAKPQRVVGFDEVGVYVIPYDADVKLKQELLNRGYAIAEYDPKVEGDRQRVVNQFEEYKFSLSNVGEQHTPDSLSALRYEAPVKETLTTGVDKVDEAPVTAEDMSALFPNNAVPVQEELDQLIYERDQIFSALEIAVDRGSASEVGKLAEEYEALNARIKALESTESARTGSITDADAPAEMDAPFYGEETAQAAPDDPFEQRDIAEVGKRSVKAYQYENPEVKPFFQEAALGMLYDVRNTTKGEKWYNDELYYATGGEQGFGGTKRHTTDDIAELKDVYGYTYDQIEAGLNAIIEDDGAENNAVSKRIEFMLNDRLLNGYRDIDGRPYEPNQGYIQLLNEKQITEYSKEAFDSFMANADQYAPSLEESYAPILNSDPRYEQTAPVYDLPGGQQTYVPTKATYDATPTDDIAPLFDATGKKGVPDGQIAFMPDAGVEKKQTRKEYHQSIIDNIKSIFKGRGFDFDKVLKDAKNLSTWSTVDNTPQRVMEKALGYKQGGILADITVNKVAQNESQGIKWLNSYVDQLKQISKQYGIKPGSKESAAAQMFAEGFYVNENNEIIRYGEPELIQDFGNADVRRRIKGLARDPRIRKIYDDTLASINESRARNLYPEIPRLDNYFLHFRAMEDTFSTLGLPFNPNDIRAKDLPTDLNGVTADLKPGQPYFASANHRTGKRTSFDLLGGVERYLNSAKNQIYHIDDIQTLRALRNYIAETYGQATGLEDIDSLTDAEAEERIKQVYDSHLSTFAKFLNEEANVLAGKTALIDRGIEGIIGRRGITFLNALNKQVGSNMVGYNVSSSLTNFLPVVQTFAKTNKFAFTKAFAQTVANKLTGGRFDSFAEDSPVVIRRKGEDRFYRTLWQKMADPGYALMGMVDDISTEIIARTKYNEFTRKGMDSQKAHFETDKWVSRLMGDRSLGQQPQLYNSKMLGLVTKFQLEVRNQLDSQFYDTIQETKVSNEHIKNGLARNAKTAAKVASVFTQLAVAQHLYGMAFESMAGYNPAFDIIEVLMTAFGFDDEEDSEDTLKDNLGQGFEAFMEDLPYASIVTGGGRIPISSALPIKEFFKGEDQYGNEKNRWETIGEVAPYYLMPGGYGQAKKTYQGLKMFSDDHPIAGSYTDAGNLRFNVEDTVGSRIKAGIFGQYASENAQKYFDQEQRTLNPEQTEIFAGLDIPIEEYWEYRDNLYAFYDVRDALKDAAYADGATDEDVLRYTYINNIYGDIYDLYDKQKEIAGGNSRGKTLELRQLQKQMEKMLSESKFGVDSMKLSGAYAEVGGVRYNKDADSGRWYEIKPKNADGSDNWYYQKEQEVTKGLGISYEAYWNNREEYNYAYDKPGRYAIAQAVGGYDSYREYYDALENWQSDSYIAADKDAQGNSISGSRKKKVLDYINGLDLDYGERIILYRTVYSSKSDKRTYNQQIIDYLNERDDISYQEMKSILEELDMEVDAQGYISW